MSENMDPVLRERLKSSLWYSIGQIVDQESLRLGVNATPQFIGALTEMVWSQTENVAQDLECFARHAGRSTVTTEDVLLICRRNEALEGILRGFVEEERAKEVGGDGKVKGKGKWRR